MMWLSGLLVEGVWAGHYVDDRVGDMCIVTKRPNFEGVL